MSEAVWGPEIQVNEERPAWLDDDTRMQWKTRWLPDSGWVEPDSQTVASWRVARVRAIRLLADHPAYKTA